MTPVTSDPATLPDPQPAELLGRLDREERTVSRRLTALRQIDELHLETSRRHGAA